MEDKFELHTDLQDASLEKVCKMANSLLWVSPARLMESDR